MGKNRTHGNPSLSGWLLFNHIQDPLFVVDEAGRVIYANSFALKSFDFGRRRMIENIRNVEDRFTFDQRELPVLIKGNTSLANYRLKYANGRDSNTIVNITPIAGGKQFRPLKLVHLKDLSDFRKDEKWRDETITMVSHELKNPLSAMKNVVSILLSGAPGPLSEHQKKFLSTAVRSIDRLTHLLESILDVSRISLGRLKLKQDWVEIDPFLSDVVSSFKTLFNVQHIELSWTIEDDIENIYVDASKLEQVLINLLSNALKYTPEKGKIQISVSAAGLETLNNNYRLLPWHDLPYPRFVRFVIEDTGIGMNEETLGNLFTRYYQGSQAEGRRGAHLGLSISKSLVEVQGGHLNVESQLGLGTKVTFTLPRDERTEYIIQCLKTVKRHLKSMLRENKDIIFFTAGKESSECWMNLCKTWSIMPDINLQGETNQYNTNFYLWTLSEYIGIGFISGEYGILSPEKFFGDGFLPCGHGSYRYDGFTVGLSYPEENGDKLEQLFNISLKRMKQASGFVKSPT